MTVSRALSNPDKVAKDTLHKIRAAIKAVGYVPNLAAGTLRMNESMIVGAIVPTIGYSIFSETVQGITDSLAGSGYQLLLACSDYNHAKEEELVSALLGQRVDGIILTGTQHTAYSRKLLRSGRIPIVETWDLQRPIIDMAVGFSNYAVGEAIGERLIAAGYKRFGYVSGTPEHESNEQRAANRSKGFLAALDRAGLKPPKRAPVPDPLDLVGSGKIAADFVERNPEIEIILCINEIVGVGTITELRRRGIAVPQRIAVAGIGDANISALIEPGLTTVHIRGHEIGRLSAELMMDQLGSRPVKKKLVDVGFEIIERGSTRRSHL
jgi:LacI family gluconate utilization system Gnt-I transcriptional repressor